MSRVSRPQVLCSSDDESLAKTCERKGVEAAERGDFKTACHYRQLAIVLMRRAIHARREEMKIVRAWARTRTRVRDSRGRFVARRNGNGHRRARERRDGGRSSARSGDSGSADDGPEPARHCRCPHPLVIADSCYGQAWCRCFWCGHERSRGAAR